MSARLRLYIKNFIKKMSFKKNKGSISLGNCNFGNIEDFLEANGAKFTSNLCEDFDNAYRDFKYKHKRYTLHWNNYLGIEIIYYDNDYSLIKNLLSKFERIVENGNTI